MAPTTIAIAALGVAAAGTGLAAVGQIQAGRAAKAQAQAQQSVAEYNAAVAEREAQSIEAATQFKQRRQAKEAARIKSSLLAKIGASGAVPGAGTALLLEAEQAAEMELENLMIGYEGRVSAQRARSQSSIHSAQASIYGMRGSAAYKAGMIGAGSTLLTGFGQIGLAGSRLGGGGDDD